MSKYYDDPEYFEENEMEEEDTPIDWSKYIEKAVFYWKKIFIISCIFGAIGVAVALIQKRKFEVQVTLAPEIQGSNRAGSLSSLASMFGVNMTNMTSMASDALNITIFPEVASSTPFLVQLFDVELCTMPTELPDNKIEARKMLESPLPKVKLYDHLTYRDEEPGWFFQMIDYLFGPEEEDPEYLRTNISLLTKEQAKVIKYLRKKVIAVDVDKKNAMATIRIRLDDPMMCSQLADTVCDRLQKYVFSYRTQKEQQSFDYYSALCDSTYHKMVEAQAAYAEAVDNNRSVVLQSVSVRRERLQQEASMASQIYQQMVQQREISRARLQELKPVFAVVEPATFPHKPANSRRKLVLMFGFMGFFLASAWYILGKDYYEEYMPKLKNLLKKK